MDERDVIRAWRAMFVGKEVTPQILAEAEALLESLSGESPLHLRLAKELADLNDGRVAGKKKPAGRRSAS